MDKGLPQNSIMDIFQDKNHFLWIATQEGFAKYDGKEIKVYNTKSQILNDIDLKIDYINTIREDRKGNILFGTDGNGLLIFNNKTGNFYIYNNKNNNLRIFSLFINKKNTTFIGTNQGLYVLKNKNLEKLQFNELDNKIIFSINSYNNNILIGTNSGLYCIKNNKIKYFTRKEELDKANISRIIIKKNKIYLATSKGIFIFKNNKKFKIFTMENGLLSNRIFTMLPDSNSILWIGTDKGINRIINGKVEKFSLKKGLESIRIKSIFEDFQQNIWLGSLDYGLFEITDSPGYTITQEQGLSSNIVWTIEKGKNDEIWIGTQNGLNLIKSNNVIKRYFTKDGLTNNSIRAIRFIDNKLLVGTMNGLNIFNKNKFSKIKAFENNRINDIVKYNEFIIIGTSKGIFFLKNNRIERELNIKTGLSNNWIRCLLVDDKNNLWIGTSNGLNKFKDNKIKKYTTREGISGNIILSLKQDNNKLIIGTYTGLSILKSNRFYNITTKQGLHNNKIFNIMLDNKNLWITSNRGLFKITKKDIDDFIKNKINKIKSYTYDKSQGFKTIECNGGIQPSGYLDKNGLLYIPTMKGLTIIDTNKINDNIRPPFPIIKKILIDNKKIFKKSLNLKPFVKRIEIYFTAPDFIFSDKIGFKYKLIGFDRDWVTLKDKSERKAIYTSLNNGKFIFKLKSYYLTNNLENEKAELITIHIESPYYKTWWFVIIIGIFFSFISYLVINLIKKLHKTFKFWRKQQYIGEYKLIEKIGSGGMGEIYKAEMKNNGKKIYAIKLLLMEKTDNEFTKRIKREAEILKNINHKNIVKIIDYGFHQERPYIVMEYLSGITLKNKILREHKLKIADVKNIILQILDAIKYIHNINVIHRDIKPANIMLMKSKDRYSVKLLDFGLARGELQTKITQSGMIVGTLNYLAPEQIYKAESSKKSDIYSIGMTAYEMLSGKLPYSADTVMEIIGKIIEGEIEYLKNLRKDISEKLNDIIMAMLNKNPEERPNIDEIYEVFNNL